MVKHNKRKSKSLNNYLLTLDICFTSHYDKILQNYLKTRNNHVLTFIIIDQSCDYYIFC